MRYLLINSMHLKRNKKADTGNDLLVTTLRLFHT